MRIGHALIGHMRALPQTLGKSYSQKENERGAMSDRSFLTWPFFEERHRELADALDVWASDNLGSVDHSDTDAACRALVEMMGAAGWLKHSAAPSGETLDVRSLCLIRETLARHDGLADFAFAMQGLGTGAISLFGTAEQQTWLEKHNLHELECSKVQPVVSCLRIVFS